MDNLKIKTALRQFGIADCIRYGIMGEVRSVEGHADDVVTHTYAKRYDSGLCRKGMLTIIWPKKRDRGKDL
jgi:hypothetical protein